MKAPRLMTVTEVAEYLRVSRASAYQWVADGIIPSYRVGPPPRPGQQDRRLVRVKTEDLAAFLEGGRCDAA